MSVVVMGMEMPADCWECRFCTVVSKGPSPYCDARKSVVETPGKPGVDCPLRPLPEKHGDLVDISQEVNIEYFDDMNQEWSLKAGTVADALSVCEEFPVTIVEAEV